MISKKDELYLKSSKLEMSEREHIVMVLDEKTKYYEERIRMYKEEIHRVSYDKFMVRTIKTVS